ncbi:MAG TPA: LCP family protein [Actinomycetota bacterium]|nr:LCP family protein [Actinomycetota bacterium]
MIKRAIGVIVAIALVCVIVPLIGPRDDVATAAVEMGAVHESYVPAHGKIYVLVIGNDARFGNPDQSRADAIHLVGINIDKMRGGILNFPRDSWVSIPGHGTSKINEALYDGGPQLLAQTLESLTGIHIDYWIMTGFQGFDGLVRDLHGVQYNVPHRIDDNFSGAHLDGGKQILSGWEALSFVRSRHAWPNGDIDRTTNQAKFLLALLKKLRGQVDGDPSRLLDWIAIVQKHTRLDIPASDQFKLGVLASHVQPGRVGIQTVPVTIGAVGAASVVFISPGAKTIYAKFRKNAYL